MTANSRTVNPAMLRWVGRLEAELAGIGTPFELFIAIDRTRGQMGWMRANEPDTAPSAGIPPAKAGGTFASSARVDAAIREAHARVRDAVPASGG